jgi:hypothetical protein
MSAVNLKSQWGELITSGLQKHYTLSSYMFSKDGVILPDFGGITLNSDIVEYQQSVYPIKSKIQKDFEGSKFNHTESEILINNLLFGVVYNDTIINALKEKYGIP